MTATLIDNIFISANLYKKFESDILDHLPMLTLLRQTKVKSHNPLIFKSRNMTDVRKGFNNQEPHKSGLDIIIECEG